MIQTQKNELNVFQDEEKNSIENKNNENDYDNDKNQKLIHQIQNKYQQDSKQI